MRKEGLKFVEAFQNFYQSAARYLAKREVLRIFLAASDVLHRSQPKFTDAVSSIARFKMFAVNVKRMSLCVMVQES